MARAVSISLPLPLELVTHIIKRCAEYDITEDPNDRYGYFLAYKNADDRYEQHQVSWTNAPASVKQDICNVRLMCKQFRSASSESFDTMLGDRRFRLTETGIQDLQDISRVKELVPWIKTLTFGTAQLSQRGGECFLDPRYVEKFPEIAEEAEALQSAWSEHMARQQSVDYKSALAQILVAFQNLKSARIVVVDKAECPGGWLTPGLRGSADIYRNVCSTWQPGP
jgi:hypothetical protein